MRPVIRTLDRYIVKETLPPFVLALLVSTLILLIPPMLEYAEKFLAKGVEAWTILRLMNTLVPQALAVTIPMALLIGLLVGLGRLSSDREIVVMQACGVSLTQLLRPVGALALAAWAGTSYAIIVAVPSANQTFKDLTYTIITARAENEIRPRVFFEDFPNLILYVQDAPPEGGGWRDVFLADLRQPSKPTIYVAREGRLALEPEKRLVHMVLQNGSTHSTGGSTPDAYEVAYFARTVLSLDPESVFPRSSADRGFREMTIPELRGEAEKLRAGGHFFHAPLMEIHKKFSIPAACLVFALIALAVGVSNRRDGKLAAFVVGIGVIFAYYIVMYLGEALAKAQTASAWFAMWAPNILLGILGVLMLIRRQRSGTIRLSIPAISWPFRRPVLEGAATAVGAAPRTAAPAPKRIVVVVKIPDIQLPAPGLIDRYITRQDIHIFALALVGLLGIFYISTFIDLSDKLFKGQTTGPKLAQYLYYSTPQFLYYIIPMAALLSALVTIGVLTKNSELIVMRACGVSLYRAAAPLILMAVIWSLSLFWIGENILARANTKASALRHEIRTGAAQRTVDLLNRRWLTGKDGRIYHYNAYDPREAVIVDLSVYEIESGAWSLASRTYARRASYSGDGPSSPPLWHGRNGWERRFSSRDARGRYDVFSDRALRLEPPDYFGAEQPDPERMSYAQLKRYIDEARASGFNIAGLAVALQRKASFPFVTIIMTLIAVPFAVTTGRSGALYGIGVGIVLSFVYWGAISAFAAIGVAGLMNAALAAWAPNVLFGAAAAYLLLTART